MDFDTPPTPPECEPFYLTPPPCSPVTSPAKSPKLKYNPRVVKKIPNSIWKAKKRLEAQMNPFFPGFRPEIVLHPEEMAPENSDEKLVQLKIGGKLKKSQIEKLTKCFPVPSYPTLMKKINATIPDIPDVNPADISERSNVIFKDFFSFAKARIQNSDKLPKKGPIRMGIQSDAGGGRTLFTFNFIDAPNPNSPNSHACFAMYDGSDKRECMYDIVENINDGAEKLQREGIIVNGVKRDVVCFLNGDLKIRCEFCGIQTGKPKKFCCKCKTENPKTLGEMRTIEEIAHNFNEFQAEYSAGKQNANRCKLLKQKYNNVNGAPLIPCIPLTRVVPPPLHILMALFNKFLFFVMCDEIQRFLNSLNVVTTQGRKEYNGNDCRKILQKISQSPKNFKGPHADVFILMAKVEKYAKAEPLTEKEMNDLENLIGQLFEKLDTFSCFKEGHKLHELRFHVIPFIREHGSWGLFSEQGLEALHHVFNDYRDKIIAKESDFKKNNYAFRSHMQQIFAFKM